MLELLSLFGGVASAQIATSTVTGTVGAIGSYIAAWTFDVLPTVFLYIIPLMLLWLFVRWIIRVGRGG